MILIGLGANLPSRRFGPPERTLPAVLDHIDANGIAVTARSRWYRSAPVPVSDDPWYVNGVALVETLLPPSTLLARLLEVEMEFGRERGLPNAPRTVDLDLLDYNGKVLNTAAGQNGIALSLPHPRMVGRPFVLLPLRDVAPAWKDPVTGESIDTLIADLGPVADVEPLTSQEGAG